MGNLEIAGKEHRTFRHAGQAVLRVTLPTLTGDTAMAAHAKALLENLLAFAEETLAKRAGEALFCAVRAGKLSAFSPHQVIIHIEKTTRKCTCALSLVLTVRAEGESRTVCRRFFWTVDETLRKRAAFGAKMQRKTRKRG